MRAIALHPDVLLVTSALLRVNCVVVRGGGPAPQEGGAPPREGEAPREDREGEAFVIDSPVLPDELDALPALIEQARFPAPAGLLATHGDWDHLLGRLAFPQTALGCAQSTAQRLAASPGEAQRELRRFDEELMIERPLPLSLGAVQPLPVPGRCELGDGELELHATDGHTRDGMAVLAGWAGVLVAGDYLSSVEIPTFHEDGGSQERYLHTLERLRELLGRVEHVVPGHGPALGREQALAVLEQDVEYLHALRREGAAAKLPAGRRSRAQRERHERNAAALEGGEAS